MTATTYRTVQYLVYCSSRPMEPISKPLSRGEAEQLAEKLSTVVQSCYYFVQRMGSRDMGAEAMVRPYRRQA